MNLDKDITHNFNLTGMVSGDWLLGCNNCWYQLGKNTAGNLTCPQCRGRLSINYVKDEDGKFEKNVF